MLQTFLGRMAMIMLHHGGSQKEIVLRVVEREVWGTKRTNASTRNR